MALELSEEGRAMMGYNLTSQNPSDVYNNNNNNDKNEKSPLNERKPTAQCSSTSKAILAQCLVTGAVLLVATGGGIPIGYSAVLLPQLSEENNSTLYVDRETGSWIEGDLLADLAGSRTNKQVQDRALSRPRANEATVVDRSKHSVTDLHTVSLDN